VLSLRIISSIPDQNNKQGCPQALLSQNEITFKLERQRPATTGGANRVPSSAGLRNHLSLAPTATYSWRLNNRNITGRFIALHTLNFGAALE
jgi:hypothetical protein